ncbi:molecular chaperone DnaK [bacterium]|nr:molecular chaperone DnaK [bacterium]
MSKIIGIDLGTTNSCVTVMEGDEVIVIPNSEGSRTTSSVVAFINGEELVGQVAKRQAVTNHENTVYAIKRLIGKKYDDPEITAFKNRVPFKVIKASNNDAWVEIAGKQFSPQEISSKILSTLKEIAEDYIGESISEAVITVPAYFDDAQRQATKDAGKIAGLDVKRIINEPTAAALAYGLEKKVSETIAVYDLGGGTFDVSILKIDDGVFEVKATNGNTMLGGEDFDIRIMNFLLETFEKENGIDLSKDKTALQRIKEAAEKAKHELSSVLETEISIPFITADATGAKHLVVNLARHKFESLVDDLIEKTLDPCRIALKDAGLSINDIDEVILVGGMTRMVKVQDKVTSFFGKAPHKGIDPDEVVAIGASIQGAVLTGEIEHVLLLDVTPLSLGIETKGGIFTKLIEKNTTIPVRVSEIFTTALDNQSFVTVHVLQGERELSSENRSLARFELTGIPAAARGVPQIQVTFDIDANGILHVSAKDLGTGEEKAVQITPTSGLNEMEINKIVQEAKNNKIQDEQRKKVIELSNNLETVLYSAKNLLSLGGVFEEAKVKKLKERIEDAEKALKERTPFELQVATDNLNALTHELSEALYK